jgi:hypothetical protein
MRSTPITTAAFLRPKSVPVRRLPPALEPPRLRSKFVGLQR